MLACASTPSAVSVIGFSLWRGDGSPEDAESPLAANGRNADRLRIGARGIGTLLVRRGLRHPEGLTQTNAPGPSTRTSGRLADPGRRWGGSRAARRVGKGLPKPRQIVRV